MRKQPLCEGHLLLGFTESAYYPLADLSQGSIHVEQELLDMSVSARSS